MNLERIEELEEIKPRLYDAFENLISTLTHSREDLYENHEALTESYNGKEVIKVYEDDTHQVMIHDIEEMLFGTGNFQILVINKNISEEKLRSSYINVTGNWFSFEYNTPIVTEQEIITIGITPELIYSSSGGFNQRLEEV